MTVRDIMTKNPTCATPDMALPEAARMMVDCDCGEIPVVDSASGGIPIGVITDRDITVRAVAKNRNPLDLRVRDCMSQPAIVVELGASVDELCEILEEHKIRRVPVVDTQRRIVGIVSQADLARRVSEETVGQVVYDVSQPGTSARAARA